MGISEGGQARTRQRKLQYLGSGLSKRPCVKRCGFPRLSVDGFIQTKRNRILVSSEGFSEGGPVK